MMAGCPVRHRPSQRVNHSRRGRFPRNLSDPGDDRLFSARCSARHCGGTEYRRDVLHPLYSPARRRHGAGQWSTGLCAGLRLCVHAGYADVLVIMTTAFVVNYLIPWRRYPVTLSINSRVKASLPAQNTRWNLRVRSGRSH